MEIILNQPYSFCQIGRRSNQEDARFPDENAPQDYRPAFILCDGVGGHDKGEIASRTVADAMGLYMSKVDLSKPFSVSDFGKTLEYAYDCLNKKISKGSRDMATTMTFVCFHGSGVLCAHIGDSRIYHIRPEVGILYRSEDHSLVNALVHSGNITPEEAIDHPQGNVITRCMGYSGGNGERCSATAIQIEDIEPGDYFFLCTDGVLHCLEETELLEILESNHDDKEKLRIISEKCRMSSDNNTAYLVSVANVDNISHESKYEVMSNTPPKTTEIQNGKVTNLATEVKTPTKGVIKKASEFLKNFFN